MEHAARMAVLRERADVAGVAHPLWSVLRMMMGDIGSVLGKQVLIEPIPAKVAGLIKATVRRNVEYLRAWGFGVRRMGPGGERGLRSRFKDLLGASKSGSCAY